MRPATPFRASKSPSWVRTGISCAAAVAAIHMSLMFIRRAAAAIYARICAHARATCSSTGSTAMRATASRVSRRLSRVSMSFAERMPARSSALVMTEIAPDCGMDSCRSGLPCSIAMNTEVSSTARAGGPFLKRLAQGHRRRANSGHLEDPDRRNASSIARSIPRAASIAERCYHDMAPGSRLAYPAP